jgi:hypothetical protein
MYNTIREKIRENMISEAFQDMDALRLSREHTSRLVNLHRRYRVYQDKAIANLAEERLLRIEENGIVEDMLTFLDMVEFPANYEQEEEKGAAAGAVKKTEKSKQKGNRWLLPALGLLVVALTAFWMLQPEPKPTPTKPSVELRESPDNPTTRAPDNSTTRQPK